MTKTLSLLDELEQIDDALLNREPTEEQEKRGQELVALANAAPAMLLALESAERAIAHSFCLPDPERVKEAHTELRMLRAAIAEVNGEHTASTCRTDMENAERAERARRALEGYNDDYDIVANAVDFLTDLQHYCHFGYAEAVKYTSFAALLEVATCHFNAEISEE